MPRILLIDDDRDYQALMKAFFKQQNYEFVILGGAAGALEEIRSFKPDLLILDIMMPGITGATVYKAVRKEIGSALPILIISGTEIRLRDVQDPFLKYLRKPVDLDILAKTIDKMT
ncbi:response regulator [Candidatus Sumerlaeota bacterium]|nr:response regulator [Candidatus Sumerlaeota bacterium]